MEFVNVDVLYCVVFLARDSLWCVCYIVVRLHLVRMSGCTAGRKQVNYF